MFLNFTWEGQSYQFESLHFGLASAPRTFTKLLLVLASSSDHLTNNLTLVAKKLEKLGFTLNQKKCVWSPTQTIEFRGFMVNSLTMTVNLPHHKMEKIEKKCRHMSHKHQVTARQLAHLIGLLSSQHPQLFQPLSIIESFRDTETKSYNRAGRTTIIQQEWTRNR